MIAELLAIAVVLLVLYKPLVWLAKRLIIRAESAWSDLEFKKAEKKKGVKQNG